MIVAETARRGNSCDPKVKTMVPNKVGRSQGHYWVHNRRGRSSISRPDRSKGALQRCSRDVVDGIGRLGQRLILQLHDHR